jgi:hypothetical protein
MYQLTREQRERRKPDLSIKSSFIIRPGYCSRCGSSNTFDDVLVLTDNGWIHYGCLAYEIDARMKRGVRRFK